MHAPFRMCTAGAAHVLSAHSVRPRSCACAQQDTPLFEAVLTGCLGAVWMQKIRPQSVQVRPRTAIERVPSPATQPTLNLTFASQPNHAIVAAHGAGERLHLLGVRVGYVRRLPGRMGAWLTVWWPW